MRSIRSRSDNATRNSPPRRARRDRLGGLALLLAACTLPALTPASASPPDPPGSTPSPPAESLPPASSSALADADPAARAERRFQAALTAHARDPDNVTNAWQLGRAAFDRAEFARDPTERAALAEQGIAALRPALARHPNLAALPYYLGMNLGQLARTRSLGALPLVREMETLFQRARELDEHFDQAGPDRNLGLLYLEAPGWPLSIGHRGKARQHLERAVALAPDYPENWLNLLEARLRWGDPDLRTSLGQLDRFWAAAQARYAGEDWTAAWADWERRRQALRAKLPPAASVNPSPSAPAESHSPSSPTPGSPGDERRDAGAPGRL